MSPQAQRIVRESVPALIVALVVSAAGAGLALYVNVAVAQQRFAEHERRIQIVEISEQSHYDSLWKEVRAISESVARIEERVRAQR